MSFIFFRFCKSAFSADLSVADENAIKEKNDEFK